jgi:hypothetical protein
MIDLRQPTSASFENLTELFENCTSQCDMYGCLVGRVDV